MHYRNWLLMPVLFLFAIAILAAPTAGFSQHRPKPCMENGVECTLECYAPPADLHCPRGARICSSTCGGGGSNRRVADSGLPWAPLLVAIRLVEFGSVQEWHGKIPEEKEILQALKPALVSWISEITKSSRVQGWYLSQIVFSNGKAKQIVFLTPSTMAKEIEKRERSSVIQTWVIAGDFDAMEKALKDMKQEEFAETLLKSGKRKYLAVSGESG